MKEGLVISNSKMEKIAIQLAAPIVNELGLELVDAEYIKEAGSWCLRIFIDKEGGIGINDCEAVSRRLSAALDEKDPISDSYYLEVSSPGLDRPLKKEADFIKYTGSMVEVRLYKAIEKKKEFTGKLKSFNDNEIELELENNQAITFLRKEVALVRLAVIF